jgi:thioredoxin 2
VNKVQREKALKQKPTCGKCHRQLDMHGLVSEVSSEGLRKILTKSEVPVIVDFWASWCGPCRVYGPEFEKASLENNNAVFLKINTETNQELSAELGIRSIPTTLVFKQGREVKRQSGSLPKETIKTLIN